MEASELTVDRMCLTIVEPPVVVVMATGSSSSSDCVSTPMERCGRPDVSSSEESTESGLVSLSVSLSSAEGADFCSLIVVSAERGEVG